MQTSSLTIILTLQLILKIHDDQPVGVSLGDTMMYTLGDVDDLTTLVESADPTDIQRSSHRVTQIFVGSEADTDMSVSCPKTNVLHVQSQDPVSVTSIREVVTVCKYKCSHLGCDHMFHTQWGGEHSLGLLHLKV